MKNWLEIYRFEYKSKLDINSSGNKRGLLNNLYNRSEGYDLIFQLLTEIKTPVFNIIETGTVRTPNNWKDGNSGFLFSEFVKHHGGLVRSVDINQAAVNRANSFIDQKYYKSYCSDSVKWLSSLNDLQNTDLFYLDSYDVKWNNDTPSAEHHLNEFKIIEPFLRSNSIVAIDDNSFFLNGNRTGKGRMIVEYLEKKNKFPIYDKYQIIYQF